MAAFIKFSGVDGARTLTDTDTFNFAKSTTPIAQVEWTYQPVDDGGMTGVLITSYEEGPDQDPGHIPALMAGDFDLF
ncbi:hypothetical protein [Acuticoccus sp. I52.16.1]|uniref:hypothetical protein n=1 Tax=Acuticoccus sp. I52.16.1 TaxID=2928472 RepID=UPI001FD525CB|nr:hypothetical protein [Acuticoccus sp. I52.16.1]UOM34592.1 hypothetical protein MRB58_22730 [Acuticoccus sp. I52.16.1]